MVHKGVNNEVLNIFVQGKIQNGFADMVDLDPLAEKLKKVEPRADFKVMEDPPRILFTLGNVRARIDQTVLEILSSHEYKLLLQAYRQVEDICLERKGLDLLQKARKRRGRRPPGTARISSSTGPKRANISSATKGWGR